MPLIHLALMTLLILALAPWPARCGPQRLMRDVPGDVSKDRFPDAHRPGRTGHGIGLNAGRAYVNRGPMGSNPVKHTLGTEIVSVSSYSPNGYYYVSFSLVPAERDWTWRDFTHRLQASAWMMSAQLRSCGATLATDGDILYFVVQFSGPVRVVAPSPGPTIHELAMHVVTNQTAATSSPPYGLPTLVFSTNRTQPNLGPEVTTPALPGFAAFVGGGVGETRAFWMNAEANGLNTAWPTPCRSGGVRQIHVFGDEFCVFRPPTPSLSEQNDGAEFPYPRAHPGLTEHRSLKSTERTLVFQYVVDSGQRTSRLDFIDEWALRTNGAAIVEADDIAEGTGKYPYNDADERAKADAKAAAGGEAAKPRPSVSPHGPMDRSPLPPLARGVRLAHLRLDQPGDEMRNEPGLGPLSLSGAGSAVRFVIGNAYVLRVTSDAPVHLSEPVTVTCDWVVGEGDRLGDRMCPDIRLVMETGNLTGNTTTGKPAYPLFPTGFLFESKRENRPPDGSVLNFQYVVRLFDNVETLQYSGRDALQVMGTAAVSPGLHRPPVSDVVWGGPWGDLARAMVKERSAGRPWPPQPYREWVPNVEGVGFGDRFYGMNLEFEADARRWSGDASRNGGGDGYYVDHPAAEVPSATAPRPPVEGVSLVLPAIDDPRALHHQRKLRISTEWILPDQTVWDKPPYVK